LSELRGPSYAKNAFSGRVSRPIRGQSEEEDDQARRRKQPVAQQAARPPWRNPELPGDGDKALQCVVQGEGARGVGDDLIDVGFPGERHRGREDQQVDVVARQAPVRQVLDQPTGARGVGHRGAELATDRRDREHERQHDRHGRHHRDDRRDVGAQPALEEDRRRRQEQDEDDRLSSEVHNEQAPRAVGSR